MMIANEFICSRLAQVSGVPTPIGDVAYDADDEWSWVTAQISLDGQEFAPAALSAIAAARPSEAAAIAVFDVWIQNFDRHEYNLIYNSTVGLWAIDHELALTGPTSGDADYMDEHKDDLTHSFGFTAKELNRTRVREWVRHVQLLPQKVIDSTLEEARARRLVDAPKAKAIRTFLTYRQRKLATLVSDSLKFPDDAEGALDV